MLCSCNSKVCLFDTFALKMSSIPLVVIVSLAGMIVVLTYVNNYVTRIQDGRIIRLVA
jgi:hypothetical protein